MVTMRPSGSAISRRLRGLRVHFRRKKVPIEKIRSSPEAIDSALVIDQGGFYPTVVTPNIPAFLGPASDIEPHVAR